MIEDIDTIGMHTLSVGPPMSASTIKIETYGVTITSHQTLVDIVSEGVPILYEAVTEPAGYEDQITWVSSTKYGDAKAVVWRYLSACTRSSAGGWSTYAYRAVMSSGGQFRHSRQSGVSVRPVPRG